MREKAEHFVLLLGATLRPSTIEKYRTSFNSLFRFLDTHHPEVRSYSELRRRPHLEGWLIALATRRPPYTHETRKSYILHVRRLFDHLIDQLHADAPPQGLLGTSDLPPCRDRLPNPLSPEVDAAIQRALIQKGNLLARALLLARFTGVRRGELMALPRECVIRDSEDQACLRIPLGKLRNERVIPIDQQALELVEAIRKECADRPAWRNPETGRMERLLACKTDGSQLSYVTLRKTLKNAARLAGITERVYPHRLRHTYATELIRAGMSLPSVMRLLGHRRITMTLQYVNVTQEDLIREFHRVGSQVRQHYPAELGRITSTPRSQTASAADIAAAFEDLISRIQRCRFEQQNPSQRQKLQRLTERLRRAQSECNDLTS